MDTLFLDFVIISSLVCAIYFCWRLNKKLYLLKDLQLNIQPMLENLSTLADKLSLGMNKISGQMVNIKGIFDKEMPKTKGLKEDIELLLEYCESSTKRLETLIKQSQETKKELYDVLDVIAKALPKDMQENLKSSTISVDFEALRNEKIKDVMQNDKKQIIPHKIEKMQHVDEIQLDETLLKNMKDVY